MAQEKEYSDLVQEQAEKLKEALKKKRREEANETLAGLAGVFVLGPMLVVLIMGLSLAACSTMDVMMQ